MIQHTNQVAQNATRAPILASGNCTKLSVATSAATAQLKARTVYRVSGDVDFYFAVGDTAALTASSVHTRMVAGAVEFVMTGDGDVSRYFSAVDTAATGGTVYITECL